MNCDIAKNAKIIDIGCGNGLLLLALAERGYSQLVGVDYCSSKLYKCERNVYIRLYCTDFVFMVKHKAKYGKKSKLNFT